MGNGATFALVVYIFNTLCVVEWDRGCFFEVCICRAFEFEFRWGQLVGVYSQETTDYVVCVLQPPILKPSPLKTISCFLSTEYVFRH